MDSSAPVLQVVHPANLQIPVDLFVSKKHPGLTRGDLGFADSSGNIVYKVVNRNSPHHNNKRFLLVLDAAGNPLISIYPKHNGSWQGFHGDDGEEKDLLFRVQRTLNKLTKTELEVFLGENCRSQDSTSDFKVKGCPFQRSCTIYKGNSIVAQTSLMYKLRQLFVSRGRFRLTIYPGFVDHALIVALIVIFLDC